MNYRYKSTEKLIEAYIFEYDRINKEDREINQKRIKQELLERAKRLVKVLEDEANIKWDLETRSVEEEAQAIMRFVLLRNI